MKKLLLLTMFVLLIIPITQASELYKEDFSNINSQTFNLKEKDAIRLSYLEKETEIMLRAVNQESGSIKLTIFIENAETPQYATIATSQRLLIDVNKDKIKDIVIQPLFISQENTVIAIEKLQEQTEIQGLAIQQEPSKTNLKTGIYISIAIIILGLILYLFIKKKKPRA